MPSLKSIAMLGFISMVAAVTNDLSTYPRCSAAEIDQYGIKEGAETDEPIVYWRHFDGNGSIYDGSDIVCVFNLADSKFAGLDDTGRLFTPRQPSELATRDPKCVGYPCQTATECKKMGCKKGCASWYQCAPENCTGLTTACV